MPMKSFFLCCGRWPGVYVVASVFLGAYHNGLVTITVIVAVTSQL